MLDLFAAPQVLGSLRAGLEILETELHRLDLEKLSAYVLRYQVGVTVGAVTTPAGIFSISRRAETLGH